MTSILSVMSSAVGAADVPASLAPNTLIRSTEASHVATLANMVGGLIAVLALIFLLAYIVKRLNLVPSNGSVIKTIAVTPIGQREKVVIVEVNGQQYLLGVTSQQINLIDKLATPVEVESHSFASRLKHAKEQR